jgi:hypothetical protein
MTDKDLLNINTIHLIGPNTPLVVSKKYDWGSGDRISGDQNRRSKVFKFIKLASIFCFFAYPGNECVKKKRNYGKRQWRALLHI